ncbi:MAG: hypothetical protein SXA11_17415 [Cyanobacteriota bacterium]|nr:hypothetical protein [Cyanobacteriota bacterium]
MSIINGEKTKKNNFKEKEAKKDSIAIPAGVLKNSEARNPVSQRNRVSKISLYTNGLLYPEALSF